MTRNIFFQHIKYRKEKKEAAKIWLSLRQSSTKKNTEKYITALRHLMFRAETMADATGAWKTEFINTIRKKKPPD